MGRVFVIDTGRVEIFGKGALQGSHRRMEAGIELGDRWADVSHKIFYTGR